MSILMKPKSRSKLKKQMLRFFSPFSVKRSFSIMRHQRSNSVEMKTTESERQSLTEKQCDALKTRHIFLKNLIFKFETSEITNLKKIPSLYVGTPSVGTYCILKCSKIIKKTILGFIPVTTVS